MAGPPRSVWVHKTSHLRSQPDRQTSAACFARLGRNQGRVLTRTRKTSRHKACRRGTPREPTASGSEAATSTEAIRVLVTDDDVRPVRVSWSGGAHGGPTRRPAGATVHRELHRVTSRLLSSRHHAPPTRAL